MNILDNTFVVSMIIILSWGVAPILYTLILKDISVELLLLISIIIIVLLAVLYIIYRWNYIDWKINKLNTRIIIEIFVIIVIGIMVTYYVYNQLSKYNTYKVAILYALASIVTILVAHIFFKENMDLSSWIGVILVLIGSIMILYESPLKFSG